MPAHNIYHVVPRDGRWVARLQGSPSVSAVTDSQDTAVQEAEEIVRQLGEGRIVVHGANGAIERVHTFEQIQAVPPGGLANRGLPTPLLIGMAALCLVGLGFALRGSRA